MRLPTLCSAHPGLIGTVMALVVLLGGPRSAAVAGQAAEPAPLASRALLLGLARAAERLVAVGDHGIVVLSDDDGATWRQATAPTRAMLTAVAFGDANHGWAVGHDGVILATTDGGATWTAQNGGGDLETVYLDVLFLDAKRGFVVGAYGQFLATHDGGVTWSHNHPVAEELHFNSISRGADGTLCLAGESGLLLISSDQGTTWRKLEVPYEGSLFVGMEAGPGRLIAAGLRGNVLVSADRGENWEPWANVPKFLVMAGLHLRDGRLVLAGQGGNFLISADGGATFTAWKPVGFGAGVSDLTEGRDGALITAGEGGVARHQLPPSNSR